VHHHFGEAIEDNSDERAGSSGFYISFCFTSEDAVKQKIFADPSIKSFLSSDSLDAFGIINPAIKMAVQARNIFDKSFAFEISQRFWEEALRTTVDIRPWSIQPSDAVPTCSVSLDLRKSTEMMNQVSNGKAYADWLECYIKILSEIVYRNYGVLDKFTGDGLLAHFPIISPFCEFYSQTISSTNIESNNSSAVSAALKAAVEMTLATTHWLDFIVPEIGIMNDSFGAAVGIALENASWSVDSEGNPLVVGKGVVQSCRLSGGKAGSIKMTNKARYSIRPVLVTLSEIELEYIDDSIAGGHKAWEVGKCLESLNISVNEIESICENMRIDMIRRGRIELVSAKEHC